LPAFFLPATVRFGTLAVRALVFGALTTHRKAAAVPQALVAADLDLAAMSDATSRRRSPSSL
jgi:hypothetical protein